MEQYALYFYIAGAAIVLLGLIWLLVVAFRVKFLWGLGLFLFPLLILVFVPKHFRVSWKPAAVIFLGCLMTATPFVTVRLFPEKIDLGERVKDVNGEIHITLTGWDRKDYSVLKQHSQAAVLQMANAEVTDATLEHLRGMENLYKLDLGNTQVTDAGMKVLKELPSCASCI
jgi:energy-coupling factor transporter transmembrane protein EcfT